MNEGTTIEHAPSTNGRVYLQHAAPTPEAAPDAETRRRGGFGRLVMPLALIATALIVLRRMQRGNYA